MLSPAPWPSLVGALSVSGIKDSEQEVDFFIVFVEGMVYTDYIACAN